LRNHHVCSASSPVTNTPTNPEPTRRRRMSTDLEETSSDHDSRFAHNRHEVPRRDADCPRHSARMTCATRAPR
jgi:hypothetical protein